MADNDYSTKTIRDIYNILSAVFKYAVHNRIISFNPCDGVELPKTKKKPIRVLTVEEQGDVLRYAKGRLYENLIIIALGTGMRAGELLGLTDSDLNFKKREITINKLWYTSKTCQPENMFSSTRLQRQRAESA